LKDVAAQEGFVGSPASYFSTCKMINTGFIICRPAFPKWFCPQNPLPSKNTNVAPK